MYRGRISSRQLGKWIQNYIFYHLNEECKGKKVKVIRELARLPDGTIVKKTTDGWLTISTVFKPSALSDAFERYEGEEPNWSDALLILKQFTIQFQCTPKVPQGEYLLVVDKFSVWDLQPGFGLKYDVINCMWDPEIRALAANERKKNMEESQTRRGELDYLLELMSQYSQGQAENNNDDEDKNHISESMMEKLIQPFTAEEFIIPESQWEVLESLTEWQTGFIPSLPSDADVLEQEHIGASDELHCRSASIRPGQISDPDKTRQETSRNIEKRKSETNVLPKDREWEPQPGTSKARRLGTSEQDTSRLNEPKPGTSKRIRFRTSEHETSKVNHSQPGTCHHSPAEKELLLSSSEQESTEQHSQEEASAWEDHVDSVRFSDESIVEDQNENRKQDLIVSLPSGQGENIADRSLSEPLEADLSQIKTEPVSPTLDQEPFIAGKSTPIPSEINTRFIKLEPVLPTLDQEPSSTENSTDAYSEINNTDIKIELSPILNQEPVTETEMTTYIPSDKGLSAEKRKSKDYPPYDLGRVAAERLHQRNDEINNSNKHCSEEFVISSNESSSVEVHTAHDTPSNVTSKDLVFGSPLANSTRIHVVTALYDKQFKLVKKIEALRKDKGLSQTNISKSINTTNLVNTVDAYRKEEGLSQANLSKRTETNKTEKSDTFEQGTILTHDISTLNDCGQNGSCSDDSIIAPSPINNTTRSLVTTVLTRLGFYQKPVQPAIGNKEIISTLDSNGMGEKHGISNTNIEGKENEKSVHAGSATDLSCSLNDKSCTETSLNLENIDNGMTSTTIKDTACVENPTKSYIGTLIAVPGKKSSEKNNKSSDIKRNENTISMENTEDFCGKNTFHTLRCCVEYGSHQVGKSQKLLADRSSQSGTNFKEPTVGTCSHVTSGFGQVRESNELYTKQKLTLNSSSKFVKSQTLMNCIEPIVTDTVTENVTGTENVTESVSITDTVTGNVSGTDTVTGNVSGADTGTEKVSITDTVTGNVSGTDTVTGNVSGTDTVTENFSGTDTVTGNVTDTVADTQPFEVHPFSTQAFSPDFDNTLRHYSTSSSDSSFLKETPASGPTNKSNISNGIGPTQGFSPKLTDTVINFSDSAGNDSIEIKYPDSNLSHVNNETISDDVAGVPIHLELISDDILGEPSQGKPESPNRPHVRFGSNTDDVAGGLSQGKPDSPSEAIVSIELNTDDIEGEPSQGKPESPNQSHVCFGPNTDDVVVGLIQGKSGSPNQTHVSSEPNTDDVAGVLSQGKPDFPGKTIVSIELNTDDIVRGPKQGNPESPNNPHISSEPITVDVGGGQSQSMDLYCFLEEEEEEEEEESPSLLTGASLQHNRKLHEEQTSKHTNQIYTWDLNSLKSNEIKPSTYRKRSTSSCQNEKNSEVFSVKPRQSSFKRPYMDCIVLLERVESHKKRKLNVESIEDETDKQVYTVESSSEDENYTEINSTGQVSMTRLKSKTNSVSSVSVQTEGSESSGVCCMSYAKSSKVYEPKKLTIDGKCVGNKVFWKNYEESPYKQHISEPKQNGAKSKGSQSRERNDKRSEIVDSSVYNLCYYRQGDYRGRYYGTNSRSHYRNKAATNDWITKKTQARLETKEQNQKSESQLTPSASSGSSSDCIITKVSCAAQSGESQISQQTSSQQTSSQQTPSQQTPNQITSTQQSSTQLTSSQQTSSQKTSLQSSQNKLSSLIVEPDTSVGHRLQKFKLVLTEHLEAQLRDVWKKAE